MNNPYKTALELAFIPQTTYRLRYSIGMITGLLVALGSAAVAAAHGGVIGYTIEGTYYPGYAHISKNWYYVANRIVFFIVSLHTIPLLVRALSRGNGQPTSTASRRYHMS